jgi:hypothetical protein
MSLLGRQEKRTLERAATSAGEPTTMTPGSPLAAAAAAPLASCTTSAMPLWARFDSIGSPMVPSPMNPTVSLMTFPFGRARRRARDKDLS